MAEESQLLRGTDICKWLDTRIKFGFLSMSPWPHPRVRIVCTPPPQTPRMTLWARGTWKASALCTRGRQCSSPNQGPGIHPCHRTWWDLLSWERGAAKRGKTCGSTDQRGNSQEMWRSRSLPRWRPLVT